MTLCRESLTSHCCDCATLDVNSIHAFMSRLPQTRGFDEPFFLPVHPRGRLQDPWLAWRRGAPRSSSRPWLRASMRPEAEWQRGVFHGFQISLELASAPLPGFLGGLFNSAHSDFQGDFPAQGQQALGAGRCAAAKRGGVQGSALSRSSRGTGLVPGRCMRPPRLSFCGCRDRIGVGSRVFPFHSGQHEGGGRRREPSLCR